MSDDGGEKSIEDIHREALALLDALQPTRRDALKVGGAALLGGGAMAVFGGNATASHGGGTSGEIGSAAEPALKVYVDTVHFHERTSDPSSPDDGALWYNSSV